MEMCRFQSRDSGNYARFKTGLAFCIRAIEERTRSNTVPIVSSTYEREVEHRDNSGLEQQELPEIGTTEPGRGGRVEAGLTGQGP